MYNNTNCQTKHGFTLVELSIAIVIVGLLIAGILVGQSLIESAKLNKFVRQMQQLEIAVGTFRTKFKSMPGDSPYFSPAGNGDGQILSTLATIDRWDGELANFWVHMYQAQMLNDGKVYSTASNADSTFKFCGSNPVNSPTLAYFFQKQATHANANKGDCAGILGFQAGGTYYFQTMGSKSRAWNANKIAPAPAAVCYDGQLIDKKMDDGTMLTGQIVALETSASTLNMPYGTYSPCGGASNYNVGGFNSKDMWGGHGINLRFEMFSQGGQ